MIIADPEFIEQWARADSFKLRKSGRVRRPSHMVRESLEAKQDISRLSFKFNFKTTRRIIRAKQIIKLT
jgi:hypothetical protein